MTAQTANKATVPVGSDGWNITGHVKQAIETTRSIIPVADQTERDGLAALFPGGALPNPCYVSRADKGQIIEKWNGARWITTPHAELTFNTPASSIPSATDWGPGTLTLDTGAVTTDSATVSSPAANQITLNKGTYAIWFGGAFGSPLTGSSFFQILNPDSSVIATGACVEFWGGVSVPNFRVTADNTTLTLKFKWTFAGGPTNAAGRVRVTRVG